MRNVKAKVSADLFLLKTLSKIDKNRSADLFVLKTFSKIDTNKSADLILLKTLNKIYRIPSQLYQNTKHI